MKEKKHNFVRRHRLRLGLSQHEVAQLMGKQRPQSVSRYERVIHQPSLETALTLATLFGVTVTDLFPNVHQRSIKQLQDRAKTLAKHMIQKEDSAMTAYKRHVLSKIVSDTQAEPTPNAA